MKLLILLIISMLVTVGIVTYVAILPHMSNPAMFKQNPSGHNVVVGDFIRDGQVERRTVTETRLFYVIRGSQTRDVGAVTVVPDASQLSFERRDGVVAVAIIIGIALAGIIELFVLSNIERDWKRFSKA